MTFELPTRLHHHGDDGQQCDVTPGEVTRRRLARSATLSAFVTQSSQTAESARFLSVGGGVDGAGGGDVMASSQRSGGAGAASPVDMETVTLDKGSDSALVSGRRSEHVGGEANMWVEK